MIYRSMSTSPHVVLVIYPYLPLVLSSLRASVRPGGRGSPSSPQTVDGLRSSKVAWIGPGTWSRAEMWRTEPPKKQKHWVYAKDHNMV